MTVSRGTTNRNDRGNTTDRRRRRQDMVQRYRADVDAVECLAGFMPVPLGEGAPACRCYRCGELLTETTVSIDRIKPGIEGGTYAAENTRPACLTCNSSTGGALGAARRKAS